MRPVMTDYRLPLSTLHPHSNISPAAMLSSGAMMPRADSYSMPYGVNRNAYPLHNGGNLSDISRYSQYSTGRPLDVPTNGSSTLGYGHLGSMIMDHSVRNGAASSDSPPFNDTVVVHPIVTGNQTIHPEIQARIQKGFFQVDKNWTCYRRNYFSVYCSFSLRPFTPNATLFLQLGNSTEPIRSFAMSISAIVNGQENENRELVQHTPKRDKQSERRPGKVKLSASHPSSIFNRALTSPNHISFGIPPHTSPILDYSPAYGAPQPASQPPAAHTFERIQFQKATANNGKRRAQQQYYNLVVELYAEVSTNGVDSRWVLIAKRLSHPMVVRGRSPGHYKDGRRDSNANMGNGDSGSSGDGGVGNGLAAGMGPSSRNHVSLVTYHPSQRNDQRYGYRGPMGTDQSPLTASPLVSSSSSSPGYDYTLMNDSMNPLESMKDTQEPTFSESFDPMMSMMHNNDDGSSHYAKRNSTFLNSNNRLSPGPKLQSLYHPRSGEPVYGRYDSIHNNSGLCS